MKVKMYKKVVSLVSAFSLALTGLTGLNISFSASADGEISEVVCNVGDYITAAITGTPDNNFALTVSKNGSSVGNVFIDPGSYTEEEEPTEAPTATEEGSQAPAPGAVTKYTYTIEDNKPTNLKWVFEKEPTNEVAEANAGAAVGFAKFRNEVAFAKATTDYNAAMTAADGDAAKEAKALANKAKADKNSYKEATLASNDKNIAKKSTDISTVNIGNLKANGQFNNVVVVKAVNAAYATEKVKKTNATPEYYKQKEGSKVYAEFKLFINPEKPSTWKDLKPNATTKVIASKTVSKNDTTKTLEFKENTKDSVYDLEIMEGQSYKLPFALTNGVDKTLSYKDTSTTKGSFTVVNGTVKAITAGSGKISVISNGDPSKTITVNVTVTQINAVKVLRSNVATISVPRSSDSTKAGLVQKVIISPKTPTIGSVTYTYSVDKSANEGTYDITANGTDILANKEIVAPNGIVELAINAKATADKSKSGIKITLTVKGTKVKTVITVKDATAPEPVKNFKEGIALNKTTGYREINLVKGSYANLNISVNPTSADSKFTLAECDANGVLLESASGITSVEKGDVVMGTSAGTTYVKATSNGKDAEGSSITSSIYKINVYEPASSIMFSDIRNHVVTGSVDSNDDYDDGHGKMVIKGGFLMEEGNAEHHSDKELEGGKWYKFSRPGAAGANEPITWTVNKPANVVILDDGTDLAVKAHVTGTYTISGVSQYTKQKYSFKAMFGAPASGASVTDKTIDVIGASNMDGVDIDGGKTLLTMDLGKKVQLSPIITGVCGNKVEYSISDADKAYVSLTSAGVLTAKKLNNDTNGDPKDITVTVKFKNGSTEITGSQSTIKVHTRAAKGAEPSVTIGKKKVAYAQQGAEVVLTVTGIDSPRFFTQVYDTTNTNHKYKELTLEEVKNNKGAVTGYKYAVNGEDVVSTGDIHKISIFAAPKDVNFNSAYQTSYIDYTNTLNVYERENAVVIYTAGTKMLTKVPSVSAAYYNDGTENQDLDLKKIGKDRTGTNKDNGIEIGQDFVICVSKNKNESSDANSLYDDIDWTISNNNIITDAVKVADENRVTNAEAGGKKYFSEYKFTINPDGYTGKVNLTGVTRNGGKTVKLTVYIVPKPAAAPAS